MITLVLGGARSGKSAVAETLAARAGGPVTYLATATVDDLDMQARVDAHRRRRPPEWETVECGAALGPALEQVGGTVLVDSLGTWVAATPGMGVDIPALVAALTGREGTTVVVSEEVGMGVHPATEAGRRFRDVVGEVNQAVAALADSVLLVVAGRVLTLDVP